MKKVIFGSGCMISGMILASIIIVSINFGSSGGSEYGLFLLVSLFLIIFGFVLGVIGLKEKE